MLSCFTLILVKCVQQMSLNFLGTFNMLCENREIEIPAIATVVKGAEFICVFTNSLMNYLAVFTHVTLCLVKPSVIEGCHVVMLYIDSCKMCPTNFLKLSRNI